MGERQSYYDRTDLAVYDPTNFMSLIIDGMAKHHCQLPSASNLNSYTHHMGQKLTGCINHGREFVIFRSYNNLGKTGANLTIHIISTMIERVLEKEKVIPSTLFIQIDGGGENANEIVLAYCSLLVARNIGLKKVVLTRLIPGHTHEDIDGKFARIWVKIRNNSILTPSEFKDALDKLFVDSRLPFETVDVFALPNYNESLQKISDTEFKGWSKTKYFQAQWIFTKTIRSSTNPLGVKVEYKSYCQNNVYVIEKDVDISNPRCIGFIPVERLCPVLGIDENINIINAFPSFVIEPAPFLNNWHVEIDKLLLELTAKYGTGNNESIKPIQMTEWNHFIDNVLPQGNSVQEYLKRCPLHIPLHKALFGNDATISGREVEPYIPPIPKSVHTSKLFDNKPVRQVMSQQCVRHTGNKNQFPLPPTMPIGETINKPLTTDEVNLKTRWLATTVAGVTGIELDEHLKLLNTKLSKNKRIAISQLVNKENKLKRIQMYYECLGK